MAVFRCPETKTMLLMLPRSLSFVAIILPLLPELGVTQKRRILRLMSPWAEKATPDGQRAFQNIVDDEFQNIDIVYKKVAKWATDQGADFLKAFKENFVITEKEAFQKRDALSTEVDQLPAFVLDAFQVIDMYRQDPGKSVLEEKKMISDMKKNIEPNYLGTYDKLLRHALDIQEEYGINVFRSPFNRRRRNYIQEEEL